MIPTLSSGYISQQEVGARELGDSNIYALNTECKLSRAHDIYTKSFHISIRRNNLKTCISDSALRQPRRLLVSRARHSRARSPRRNRASRSRERITLRTKLILFNLWKPLDIATNVAIASGMISRPRLQFVPAAAHARLHHARHLLFRVTRIARGIVRVT